MKSRKFKGLLALAMCLTMLCPTAVFAQTQTQACRVTATQGSSYEVLIPQEIDMGSEKSVQYTVGVKGVWAPSDVVQIIPDKTFLLKESTGTKADVTATVTQAKTSFQLGDGVVTDETLASDNGATTNGTITANGLTAGSWAGTFNFTIKINE